MQFRQRQYKVPDFHLQMRQVGWMARQIDGKKCTTTIVMVFTVAMMMKG